MPRRRWPAACSAPTRSSAFQRTRKTIWSIAERAPVDYISVGPINPTPTKPGRPGVGLGYLRYAVDNAPVPFYVTGGVNPRSIGDLLVSGATRFVAVRWLTEAEDAFEAAKKLRRAIDTGKAVRD